MIETIKSTLMQRGELTCQQLAQHEPSLGAMCRALDAFYSTDNVREAMLMAYRIMLNDVMASATSEVA